MSLKQTQPSKLIPSQLISLHTIFPSHQSNHQSWYMQVISSNDVSRLKTENWHCAKLTWFASATSVSPPSYSLSFSDIKHKQTCNACDARFNLLSPLSLAIGLVLAPCCASTVSSILSSFTLFTCIEQSFPHSYQFIYFAIVNLPVHFFIF